MSNSGYQNLPTIDEGRSSKHGLPPPVPPYQPKSDEAIVSDLNVTTFKLIALILVVGLIFSPIFLILYNKDLNHSKIHDGDMSTDIYVLAYSWQPEFCDKKNYDGCSDPDNYWKQHFTMHGLWPQYIQNGYPSFCSSEHFNNKIPNEIGINSLYKYWPNIKYEKQDKNYNSFWEHEWIKHGTCSGLNQYDYFNTSLTLIQSFGTPNIVSNNVNSYVSTMQLRDAFGGKAMVSLQCNSYDSNHQLLSSHKKNSNNNDGNKQEGLSSVNVTTTATDSTTTDTHLRTQSNKNDKQQPPSAVTYYLEGVFTCWSQIDNKPSRQIVCPQEVQDEDSCVSDHVFIKSF